MRTFSSPARCGFAFGGCLYELWPSPEFIKFASILRLLDQLRLAFFLDGFRQAHTREYGYDIPGREVEIVNCRLQVVGRVNKPPLVAPQGGPSLAGAQIDERAVYFGEAAGWVATKIYRRSGLPLDAVIRGPAIVEEMSATTVILPDQRAVLDAIGNILIHV